MGKNWLIRTRSNHILGPVSKEKVVELHGNGSIKADDEICSGNGFWFFLRETEMVEKFLTGGEVQSFNPISEAKDVLTASGFSAKEPTSDDITLIGSLNISSLKEAPKKNTAQITATEDALHVSDFIDDPEVKQEPKPTRAAAPETKKKVNSEAQVKLSATKLRKQPPKQDYLKYLMVLGFLVLLFLIYFRKTILNSFFPKTTITSISLFGEAVAQEEIPAKKKSSSIKK